MMSMPHIRTIKPTIKRLLYVSGAIFLLSWFADPTQRRWTALIAEPPPPGPSVWESVICLASRENARNSEADVELLKDNKLLLAYTEFYGGTEVTGEKGRIAGKIMTDQGRSWSDSFVLVDNEGQMNVMSPSLLRLKSGKIGLAYLLKNSEADSRVLYKTSEDEGKTWRVPETITPSIRYWGMNNDRLIQLHSGRMLAPLWVGDDWRKSHHTRGVVFCSDDEDRSWKAGSEIDIPHSLRGVDEPAVVEIENGQVLMMIRSDLGKIFKSVSSDSGETWSQPEPLPLDSPTAPSSIRRIPSTGDLLLIWNNPRRGSRHTFDRFPLTAAISQDAGKTWTLLKNVDETPGFTYSCVSITFLPRESVL